MDKRKRENSPVLRFLRAFFLSSQSLWSLARAVGNPLREAREARKYLFLRTHFLDEYISGQKRTVRPSRVHLFYARRKRRMNHALHLATKFDSFSLEQTKKQEKKKINTFRAKGNERNIPWYCVISPEFRRNSRPARFWETWMRRTFFIRVSRVLVFYRISMDTTPQRERGVKKVGQRKLKISFLSFFVFLFFLPFFV